MVLQMVRPSKHPDSGIYYLRQRTPRDLVGKLPTQKVRFPAHAGGGVATVKPNASHIKVSLGTREPSVAKVRHGAALAHLEAFWAALRLGPKTLSQRQIEALAGDLYQRFAQGLEDNPGSPSRWANLRSFNKQVSAGRGSVLAIIGIGLTEKERREHSFETRYGSLVDALLASHNIIPDQASRRRLIERVHIALDQAAAKLQRNADGDFSPDDNVKRFPPLQPTETHRALVSEKRILDIFKGWEREALATNRTEKTVSEYRATLERLIKFLSHDDAARVTPADIVAYKDMRLSTINERTGSPISPKTVGDGDLTALKSVFGWAAKNHFISSNPAKGIAIKLGEEIRTRGKGYTDAEAILLLKQALAYVPSNKEHPKTSAAKQWLPWLCAFTGARIGEMAQLRKADVQQAGSHWVAVITPDAGTVKNKKARDVPLHPQLIEIGFIDFVKASASGYLFINAANRAEANRRIGAIKNRVAEFTRQHVDDSRIRPNHAWRHRMVTLCRRHGVDQELRRMITGHSGEGTDEEVYGDPDGLFREICKLPHYPI